jgi:hypothetical protein
MSCLDHDDDGDDFCGCCGREVEITNTSGWCIDCASHVLKTGNLWDRTWFARFNEDCPYQVES